MANVRPPIAAPSIARLNVADRLADNAMAFPNVTAIACPRRFSPNYPSQPRGKHGRPYAAISFSELNADASRIARGLAAWEVPPGTRLALLVRPGIEFVSLVFGLLRAGMVIVLIDPGLGRRNMLRCLVEAEPEGFMAVSGAQAARVILRLKFPRARWNVTVGRRWFWGGETLDSLRHRGGTARSMARTETIADDPAAIIFTSGSTGPAKGVLYTHRMFDTQVSEIQSMYGIKPGGVDLACFTLFALFNSAMGVTTVLPEMDFSRPAAADPKKLLAAANDWRVTQAFASPAVWRVLSNHCAKTGERIPSLRKVFSCGAPVHADVLHATLACVGEGAQLHTPYGATECLPVSTIEAGEVLSETSAKTDQGAGVCVGRKFDSIDWRVIRITDDPIATIHDAEELSTGEVGELIVRGLQVSPRYATRTEANETAKITDGGFERAGSSARLTLASSVESSSPQAPTPIEHDTQSQISNLKSESPDWHRMGDVGYFDANGRFWYCGRKSQRVETAAGPLFTECVEAVFNRHPAVRRSALVGIGQHGKQTPVLVVELEPPAVNHNWKEELKQLTEARGFTRIISRLLAHPALPVDVRHNAKINREKLAAWAATRINT